MTASYCRFAQNRCNRSKRTKVIAKVMPRFPLAPRFLANAILSTDDVAKAEVKLPQSGRRCRRFDAELLYAGAMFHDMGLTHQHSTTQERFEVDSANTARDFLRSHGIAQQDIETVWTAIALHTTPGIPQHMHPVVALVTAGVEMDVMGLSYAEYSDAEREAVVHAHPRTPRFKEDIIQAFYDGNKHKPETTFGNVNADVLADKDPHFTRVNFCSVIRASAWRG